MSLALPVSEVEDVARRAESWTPQEILDWALNRSIPHLLRLQLRVGDVAVIHMLSQLDKDARVFTLDTGRLPAETYDVMERIRDAYGTKIEVFFPSARPPSSSRTSAASSRSARASRSASAAAASARWSRSTARSLPWTPGRPACGASRR
jgi:3'-phosphoadenosine 5'-phosphosulfate sulfotransferase (PAPS reductase)/FAD synthetase